VSIDGRLRDALERVLAGARASLEPELRTLADELSDARTAALASSAQALDEAGSLTEVLHALVDAAAQHADRVGLFLVTEGRVRPWQLRGLDETTLSSVRTDGATTFPVTVGGKVVAILYAEAAAGRAGGSRSLDVLTRYAGRRLESMTLHMALGIGAR
jgi:hypothetical protein